MNGFKDFLNNFMRGRNGTDDLYKFLFWVYMGLFAVNLALKIDYLDFLQWAIIFALFFRMLSKDLPRRRAENAAYKEMRDKVLGRFRVGKSGYANKEGFIYRRCPNCGTMLRLPRRSGRHLVRCPKCGERFEVDGDKEE
ncbi:MAG TPA: hypothetical protein VN369_08940 [Terriglobales bacterium]|nr:hypothetical protein [Terriglobales bacterium]